MTETLVEPVLEQRQAQVAEVNFPKRIVTVIAMPYEEPTSLEYRGKWITEIVSRGAFDGIERRTSQIKANRDHSWEKPIGRVIAVHPSRIEGLVTEIKISNTTLGTESLELTDDQVLGASAGFGLLADSNRHVYPDAESWENNRSVRRLNRLWLDHVALVPDPQYNGAVALDVRDTTPRPHDDALATPNRDELLYQELKAQNDALNQKYLR